MNLFLWIVHRKHVSDGYKHIHIQQWQNLVAEEKIIKIGYSLCQWGIHCITKVPQEARKYQW